MAWGSSTYPNSSRTAQFLQQTVLELTRIRDLVGVRELDAVAETEEGNDEGANLGKTLAGRDPSVFVRRKHAQEIVVLVHGLAKVATLLGVPPLGVGIAKLALDARGVDVAAVLRTTSPSATVCFLCLV